MKKPILCLDFDGVIHSYTSGWKGARNIPDPPMPGALKTWWDEYRLVSWQRGLMDDEKNKPMPPNWARGNEAYVRLGWEAHRVHGAKS